MTQIRVTRSRDLAASPDDAWELLADLAGLARWALGIDHSSLTTEQAIGIGAVRRVQVGPLVLIERIDTWEPGLMLGYAIEGLPPVVERARNTWTLRGSVGGCSATVISDVVPGPGLRRVAARLVAIRLGRASDAMLDGMARHLEEHR